MGYLPFMLYPSPGQATLEALLKVAAWVACGARGEHGAACAYEFRRAIDALPEEQATLLESLLDSLVTQLRAALQPQPQEPQQPQQRQEPVGLPSLQDLVLAMALLPDTELGGAPELRDDNPRAAERGVAQLAVLALRQARGEGAGAVLAALGAAWDWMTRFRGGRAVGTATGEQANGSWRGMGVAFICAASVSTSPMCAVLVARVRGTRSTLFVASP
jgi:hypothetical protein